MSEEVLKRMFGKEFVEKYRKARARAESIPQQRLEEIKKFAMENMKDSENFALKYNNLDVLLVFAPVKDELLEIRKTSAGNYKVVATWLGSESLRGPFISVFCGLEEHAKTIVRKENAATIIVGKLREDTYEGDTTYSFRCMGVIPIEDEEDEGYEPANEEEIDLSNLFEEGDA